MAERIKSNHTLDNHGDRWDSAVTSPIFTASMTFNGHSNLPYENVAGERYFRNRSHLISCTSSTNVGEYTSPDHSTLSFSDAEQDDGENIPADGVFSIAIWALRRASHFHGVVGKWDSYDGGANGNPGNARREWQVMWSNFNDWEFLMFDETNNAQLGVKYTTDIAQDTWQHFVLTYDGRGERHAAVEGCKMYINGAAVSTASGSQVSNKTAFRKTRKKEGPLYVGGWHHQDQDPHKSGSFSSGWYHMNGQIAEISIWNRALTAGEASDVYNNARWDLLNKKTGGPIVGGAKHIWRFGNNHPPVYSGGAEVQDALNGANRGAMTGDGTYQASGTTAGLNGGNPENGNYIYDRVGTAHLYGNHYCTSSDVTVSSSVTAAKDTDRPDHADILAASNDPTSLTWGRTAQEDFDAAAHGNTATNFQLKPLFISSPGIGGVRLGLTGSTSKASGHGTSEITITDDGGTFTAYKSTIG
tara:strand:+ start:1228 stop:2643 length:1416 start_codon:yes stop_codon:yes gene_type:complete